MMNVELWWMGVPDEERIWICRGHRLLVAHLLQVICPERVTRTRLKRVHTRLA